MISGLGTIIYSKDAEADRAIFRDVFGLPSVDAGGGWLIFALPSSELAFHPAETGGKHEIYLICDDIEDFVSKVSGQGVSRPDRPLERAGKEGEIIIIGQHRARRYRMTNKGMNKARGLAKTFIDTVS